VATTRFCPTCNGLLHVGHAYLALLNCHAAKSTGGKFIVRFDDNQRYWMDKLGEGAIETYSLAMRVDLNWMGIGADEITSERMFDEQNQLFIARRGGLRLLEHGEDIDFPTVTTKSIDRIYPYVSYLTATKVVQDYREGIDLVIRGVDLVSEASLYWYFCRLLGLPLVRQVFVPKLMAATTPCGNGGLKDLADVSKHNGKASIRDYREAGWSPNDLVAMLAGSCLEDPHGEWTYENVRQQPILSRMP
jgi:glutamyl/glutaminyl-tRNA synthetase